MNKNPSGKAEQGHGCVFCCHHWSCSLKFFEGVYIGDYYRGYSGVLNFTL